MTASALQANGVTSARAFRVMPWLLLAWWIAYVWPALTVPLGSLDEALSAAAADTEQGSIYNVVVILGFGAIGLYFLPAATSFLKTRQGQLLAFLMGLYVAWSCSSLLWTEDAHLTVRRLVIFMSLLCGAFGIGAGYYARTREGFALLARHVVIAAAIASLLLAIIQFRIFVTLIYPGASFKDTARITYFAYISTLAMMASLFLFDGRARRQLASVLFFFFVVFILKGRSIIGDSIACSLIVYSRITAVRPARFAALLAGGAFAIVLADLATGGYIVIAIFEALKTVLADWVSYLTIGQKENNITSLSGRMPLWKAIYPYIAAQPWQGYGFGAFWTPTRFGEMYAAAKWRATAAHNGFLDELVATGLVGLSTFLAFWFTAMYFAFRNAIGKSGLERGGYLVFGWMLAFLLFNGTDSINQNYFQVPTLVCLTAIFALLTPSEDRQMREIEEMLFVQGFMIHEVAP
jgi:O-antigen ligase